MAVVFIRENDPLDFEHRTDDWYDSRFDEHTVVTDEELAKLTELRKAHDEYHKMCERLSKRAQKGTEDE